MDPLSKRRYRRYKRNKHWKTGGLKMDYEEEVKFKLQRFMDDVKKFSERSKKRKENFEKEGNTNVVKRKHPMAASKGLYENTVLGNPSYVSVKEIIGNKYKARRDSNILDLVEENRNAFGETSKIPDSGNIGEHVTVLVSPGQVAQNPNNTFDSNSADSSSNKGLSRETTDDNKRVEKVKETRCIDEGSIEGVKNGHKRSDRGDRSDSIVKTDGGPERSRKRIDDSVDSDPWQESDSAKRERFQEVLSKALEKLSSSIREFTENNNRYRDYEKIPKQKLLELYEKRFKRTFRINSLDACSSTVGEGYGATLFATPPTTPGLVSYIPTRGPLEEVKTTYNKEGFFKEILWSRHKRGRVNSVGQEKEAIPGEMTDRICFSPVPEEEAEQQPVLSARISRTDHTILPSLGSPLLVDRDRTSCSPPAPAYRPRSRPGRDQHPIGVSGLGRSRGSSGERSPDLDKFSLDGWRLFETLSPYPTKDRLSRGCTPPALTGFQSSPLRFPLRPQIPSGCAGRLPALSRGDHPLLPDDVQPGYGPYQFQIYGNKTPPMSSSKLMFRADNRSSPSAMYSPHRFS